MGIQEADGFSGGFDVMELIERGEGDILVCPGQCGNVLSSNWCSECNSSFEDMLKEDYSGSISNNPLLKGRVFESRVHQILAAGPAQDEVPDKNIAYDGRITLKNGNIEVGYSVSRVSNKYFEFDLKLKQEVYLVKASCKPYDRKIILSLSMSVGDEFIRPDLPYTSYMQIVEACRLIQEEILREQ